MGLNGPVPSTSGSHRPAAARTFITMGAGARRALVDIVIRASSDADAVSLLAGARSTSSVPVSPPPGAAQSGGDVITFRRGVWVATLSISPVGAGSDGPLRAGAVAQAALLPPPTPADITGGTPGLVAGRASGSGTSPAVPVVGVSAVLAAAILGAGLLVARRRADTPRHAPVLPGVIPASLPPLPPPSTATRWSTTRTAEELGVSTNVVRRLVGAGKLTPEREGKAFRFDPAQVRALAAHRRPRS